MVVKVAVGQSLTELKKIDASIAEPPTQYGFPCCPSKPQFLMAHVDCQRSLLWSCVTAKAQARSNPATIKIVIAHRINQIAKQLGVSRPTVILWRERFLRGGPSGLTEIEKGRGRRPSIPPRKVQRIVDAKLHSKPKGATHWNCRTGRALRHKCSDGSAHLGCPRAQATSRAQD